MTILVREPSAEVIYLQGVCFEHTWEGRSWHETPVDDCRCEDYPPPFPQACRGPLYQLVSPGFVVYETESPLPVYDELSYRLEDARKRMIRS
jgi:hypothetical protein